MGTVRVSGTRISFHADSLTVPGHLLRPRADLLALHADLQGLRAGSVSFDRRSRVAVRRGRVRPPSGVRLARRSALSARRPARSARKASLSARRPARSPRKASLSARKPSNRG